MVSLYISNGSATRFNHSVIHRKKFRFPFRRSWELRRDISDELAHHYSMIEDEMVDRDADRPNHIDQSPDHANERQIQNRLFWSDFTAELTTRTRTTIRDFFADLSFSLRLIGRRGGTSALIILTLAIGIGAATTMVAAVDKILLQPIPIENPEQVMTMWRLDEATNLPSEVAPGTIVDWRERSKTFEFIAGAEPFSLGYDDGNGLKSLGTWQVTIGFFDILKTMPRIGRLLENRDYEDGANPVVVVAYDLWLSLLGADEGVIGTTITLDGMPHQIIGVLPKNFPYVEGRQLYVPRLLTGTWRQNRSAGFYLAYGRLAVGSSAIQADSELREIARATAREYPDSDAGISAMVVPMSVSLVQDVRPGLLLLLLSASLILLIACINAASLMLAEAGRRSRELAIRAVVGAGHSRIVRQMMTESIFLAALAGVLGLVIATAGLSAFRIYGPEWLPRINELNVDVRLVVIGMLVAILVAALVGLPTAYRALSGDLHAALKPGGRSGLHSPEASQLRSILVSVQVALAVVLLAGGGLLTRSWIQVSKADQGYSVSGMVAAEGHIWAQRPTNEARITFVAELNRQLEQLPGVQATITTSLPLSIAIGNDGATIRKPTELTPMSSMAVITGVKHFSMLKIEVKEGRVFDSTTHPDSEPVVVVNQSLANRLWPSESATGQMLEVEYSGVEQARRVIGVVADVRYRSLEQPASLGIYLPFNQIATGSMFFVITHPGTATQASEFLQSTIHSLDASLALDHSILLEEQFHEAGKARRFSAMILTIFAAVSVLLTGIGLFGLMAHTVRSTTREFAVRLALGAWPSQLRSVILQRTAFLVGAGTGVGLVVFLLFSNVLRSVLYGVATRDLLTLGVVVLIIAIVGVIAAWSPAQMASRVNPASALRAE